MFARDQSHRHVNASHLHGKSLFLTFDDGPAASATDEIIDLLISKNAPATFFVIANRAAAHAKIIQRMHTAGFAIGNHSLDHNYQIFFSDQAKMQHWIAAAENILHSLTAEPSIGFRAPAGVQTPRLHQALHELGIPLVHWNKRFFDTILPWSRTIALQSLSSTNSGSIVLLHDSQQGFRKKIFLKTLASYIDRAHELGFKFLPLRREYFTATVF